jgi:NADH oxidoreductase Hcr
VCLAGGVGITPFLSLIKDNFQEQKKINLLYSARNKSELVFYSELKQIEAPWLESTFFTTREENQDTVTSRIDAEAIKKIDYDKRDTEFLICGPHPFIRQMKKILSELKIPKSQTKVEDFFW